jgi:hypothetical protein
MKKASAPSAAAAWVIHSPIILRRNYLALSSRGRLSAAFVDPVNHTRRAFSSIQNIMETLC